MAIFGRKKKVVEPEKVASTADKVVIGAAKKIGAVVGTASGAVEIGKQSAAPAKKFDAADVKNAALEQKDAASKKMDEARKLAAKQAADAKKSAGKKTEDAKKLAAQKADEGMGLAAGKADETKKLAEKKGKEAQKLALKKAEEARKQAEETIDDVRGAAAKKIAPKKKRGIFGLGR